MFIVTDKPNYTQPSVEVRHEVHFGLCFTFDKATLASKSVEELYQHVTKRTSCVWQFVPDDTMRAELLEGLRKAKSMCEAS